MRKETEEYLSQSFSPVEFYSEYLLNFRSWKESFKTKPYTFKDTIFITAGGMGPGAARAGGESQALADLGVTFPGIFPSSASSMNWALLKLGYTPLEIHSHITNFHMKHLHHDNLLDIFKSKSLFSVENLSKHFLRYFPDSQDCDMNQDDGLNLGFLVTRMPDREPGLYTKGKMIKGIVNSTAFPVAFPIGDEVDGDIGLSYKLPISEMEEFLGFRPRKIIYSKLNIRSGAMKVVNKGLSLLTNTPERVSREEWSDGIPVEELIINVDEKKLLGMSPTDYHKQEKMNYIFSCAYEQTKEFVSDMMKNE